MAKNIITEITDDLDGSKGAAEIALSYAGVDYTIDLSKKNVAALEKALKPYLEVATKAPRRGATASKRSKAPRTPGRDLAAIRTWAKANNIEVSERGRVAQSVIDQYEASDA